MRRPATIATRLALPGALIALAACSVSERERHHRREHFTPVQHPHPHEADPHQADRPGHRPDKAPDGTKTLRDAIKAFDARHVLTLHTDPAQRHPRHPSPS